MRGTAGSCGRCQVNGPRECSRQDATINSRGDEEQMAGSGDMGKSVQEHTGLVSL